MIDTQDRGVIRHVHLHGRNIYAHGCHAADRLQGSGNRALAVLARYVRDVQCDGCPGRVLLPELLLRLDNEIDSDDLAIGRLELAP